MLDVVANENETPLNTEAEEEETIEIEVEGEDMAHYFNVEYEIDYSLSQHPSTSTDTHTEHRPVSETSRPRAKKRKLSQGDLSSSLNSAITAMGSYFNRVVAEPRKSNDDGDASMAFGRSIGLQLNLIRNSATRLRVQAQICALLAEDLEAQSRSGHQ
jgi:hypothetical protein